MKSTFKTFTDMERATNRKIRRARTMKQATATLLKAGAVAFVLALLKVMLEG